MNDAVTIELSLSYIYPQQTSLHQVFILQMQSYYSDAQDYTMSDKHTMDGFRGSKRFLSPSGIATLTSTASEISLTANISRGHAPRPPRNPCSTFRSMPCALQINPLTLRNLNYTLAILISSDYSDKVKCKSFFQIITQELEIAHIILKQDYKTL